MSPAAGPLAAVALVSAGALAYEVLLTRLMAIVHWHHFAAIVISMALLGYGASGSALAILGDRATRHLAPAFAASAALFGVTALAAAHLAQRVPFNALEVFWDPRQILHLLTLYALFAVPFLLAATCIGLAYAGLRAAHAGRIYAADLVGAGAGALLAVLALDRLHPLAALGLVAAAGPAAAATVLSPRPAWRRLALAALAAGLAALPFAAAPALRVSPYKGLSQALQVPGAFVEAERTSSLGLIDAVRSDAAPFRQVPGLSLGAPGEPAEQRGVFVDGEGPLPLTRFAGDTAPLAYLDHTTAALPYHLVERPDVLVLGAGGGAGVLTALVGGAASVDAVEMDPELVRVVREDYGEFSGGLYDRPGVRVHVSEARRFLSRAGDGRRYDVIQLPPLDALGGAGRSGLHETYAYTVEAFGEYLDRLEPGGMLSVGRWLRLPPRDALKLLLTAVAALEARGAAEPARHLMLLRSWDTVLLLVREAPFTAAQVEGARAFARERGFDLDHAPGAGPGATADRANNTLAGSSLRDDAAALLGPGREAFVAAYKFDLRPATDDRPYFFDFFRWRALPELLAAGRQGNAALVDWGYLVQLAGLAVGVLLGALLVLLPLRLGLPRPPGGVRARTALFFLAVGAGFMAVEIAVIQRLVLHLGHPVHAVATTLAAFLVFAGLGGRLAARLDERLATGAGSFAAAAPALAAAAVCGLVVAYAFGLPALLRGLVDPLEGGARAAAAGLAVAPLAAAMGVPFPLALARLRAGAPALVPWAWGVNGCASVAAALLAPLLAVHVGLTALTLLAGAAYLAAGGSPSCQARPRTGTPLSRADP